MNEYLPVPTELQVLTGAARTRAKNLLELARQIIRSTEPLAEKPKHTGFAYMGETAAWGKGDLIIEHDGLGTNTFTATGPWGIEHRLEADENGAIPPSEVLKIAAQAAKAVRAGERAGEHTIIVAKTVSAQENNLANEANPFIVIAALRTFCQDYFKPTSTLYLHALRPYQSAIGIGTIIQSCVITHNPNSGIIAIANALTDDRPAFNKIPAFRWQPSHQAEALMIRGALQETLEPSTPVNRPLDYDDWLFLLAEPLNRQDVLQSP